jgi:hypothetical protein
LCEDLARRVLEPFDLVQVVVIQLSQDRLEDARDLSKVHYPASLGSHGPLNVEDNSKGVPMEPTALVATWDMRKAVCGLERELLEDLH